MFPTLDPAGIDFMEQMFVYDPAKRLTVRARACKPRMAGVRL